VRVSLVPSVAVVLNVCFPHFAEVLKVQLLLMEVVPAAVARRPAAVPAHYEVRRVRTRDNEGSYSGVRQSHSYR
jgi:hypothetical protein